MNSKKNLEEYLKEYKSDPDFVAEELAIDITERINVIMERKGLNKQKIARLLNVSKSYISKLLNGNPNMTIKTLAKITVALDENIIIVPKEKNEVFEVSAEYVDAAQELLRMSFIQDNMGKFKWETSIKKITGTQEENNQLNIDLDAA